MLLRRNFTDAVEARCRCGYAGIAELERTRGGSIRPDCRPCRHVRARFDDVSFTRLARDSELKPAVIAPGCDTGARVSVQASHAPARDSVIISEGPAQQHLQIRA